MKKENKYKEYGELKYIYRTWGNNLIFVFEKPAEGGSWKGEQKEILVEPENFQEVIQCCLTIYDYLDKEKALND